MNGLLLDPTKHCSHSRRMLADGFGAPALNAYYLGQLFYFFEYACFVSGTLLGVNPFDQPGVGAYKKNMFAGLGNS